MTDEFPKLARVKTEYLGPGEAKMTISIDPSEDVWCPSPAGLLPTGDGLACGRYASILLWDVPDGLNGWSRLCPQCAMGYLDAKYGK